MTEKSELEQVLATLHLYDQAEVEKLQDDYRKRVAAIPRQLEKLSAMTGIAPAVVAKHCYEATWTNANLKWYEVLNVLDSFYTRLSRDQQAPERVRLPPE